MPSDRQELIEHLREGIGDAAQQIAAATARRDAEQAEIDRLMAIAVELDAEATALEGLAATTGPGLSPEAAEIERQFSGMRGLL